MPQTSLLHHLLYLEGGHLDHGQGHHRLEELVPPFSVEDRLEELASPLALKDL